jgi:metallo-beta-lactamase family protein
VAAVLTPLGAARTVTGSKHLLEGASSRVLVDCGLFQGTRDLRERNWAPSGVDPAHLDAVVITHAHLDHCGFLPRLVSEGYRSSAYATFDTGKLMAVVLPDSGRLLEEEAGWANKAGYSRHHPALPLYTEDDAWAALDLVRPCAFGAPTRVAEGVTVTFQPAGHILGSAVTHVEIDGVQVVFSGDLGRPSHPFLVPPVPVGDTDWIVVESTYGDRVHASDDEAEALAEVIDRTVARGGVVVIPAFAVDRTEVLLYHLHQLDRAGRLPDVPIYVDSPMALDGLRIYRAAIDEGADDVRTELRGRVEILDIDTLTESRDTEASKRISRRTGPAVVIAGAGMATGGRVVHHLKQLLPDPRNAVAIVGFQAEGTRGRWLLDGATSVKIHGQYVRVRAEVCDLTGFSVHADRNELLAWLGTATREPQGVFVVHGEEQAALSLREAIETELDWTAVVPRHGERLALTPR